MDVPKTWIKFKSSNTTEHLLSFPWLFPASSVVTYFRAINYSTMFSAFEKSMNMSKMVMNMSSLMTPPQRQLLERLQVSMNTYLVLDISRGDILKDALDQLWRRQKRELFRPLRVRLGVHEGEEGVDLGGVQQEFFRLALGQALDPAYGLFTVDDTTQMTWFRPCSTSPLYYYSLIGLLMGLAIYNGITLPVTFPIALYRKILGKPTTTLDHIRDGWPILSRGLTDLLHWSDGDVEDVFLRQYVFSVDNLGNDLDVDMQKQRRETPWPASETKLNGSETFVDEPIMVTNANRQEYIDDYIFWLTDKSVRPQYEAFANGLFLPLNKKSLQLFTAESFKSLVEGIQEIDVDGLERTTRYEGGFFPEHPQIRDFWEIVRSFSPRELRQLLEFVTASDRIPVKGVEEMMFVIQMNGTSDVVSHASYLSMKFANILEAAPDEYDMLWKAVATRVLEQGEAGGEAEGRDREQSRVWHGVRKCASAKTR